MLTLSNDFKFLKHLLWVVFPWINSINKFCLKEIVEIKHTEMRGKFFLIFFLKNFNHYLFYCKWFSNIKWLKQRMYKTCYTVNLLIIVSRNSCLTVNHKAQVCKQNELNKMRYWRIIHVLNVFKYFNWLSSTDLRILKQLFYNQL